MNHDARAADREHTFGSLHEAVYPELLRFVQRRAHPDLAEDIVADAFLVVWRRLDEVPGAPDEARAWIFGVTRNLLLNAHRGERRRRARADLRATLATDPAPPRQHLAEPGSAVAARARSGARTARRVDLACALAAGSAGADVVGIAYCSRAHGEVAATVSRGHFALRLPGDEFEDTASDGVELEVTYRDGTTATDRLFL